MHRIEVERQDHGAGRHGNGQLLDYTNPDAVAWWHAQMDHMLELGVDGWKTDGTGPFIMEYGVLSVGGVVYALADETTLSTLLGHSRRQD